MNKKIFVLICIVAIVGVMAMALCSCALLGGEDDEPFGIVTCSVAICEILDAMGYEDVVGVPATSDTLPERYKGIRTIGAPMEPDMEIIKQINPQLVLVPKTLEASLDMQFKTAKIKIKYIDLSDIEEMYADILEIGQFIEKEDEAQGLHDEYQQYMDSYPKSESDIKVMTIMAFSNLYTIATEDSYVGNLVKLAGAKNVYPTGYVTDGTGVVTNINLEDFAQKDPDIILVFAHFNEEYAFNYIKDLTQSDTVWKSFRAVQQGKVYYLSTDDGFGVSANLDWTKALETLRPIFYGE